MGKSVKIIIWVTVLLGATGVIAFTLVSNSKKAGNAIKKETAAVPFTVAAAIVKQEKFADDVSFRGIAEAKNTVTIFSSAEGKLISSSIETGQAFRKGQVIGSIDRVVKTATHQIDKIGFERAKAAYEMAATNAGRYEALLQENNASSVDAENARLQLNDVTLQLKIFQQQINISEKQVGETVITAPATGG